MVLESVIVCLDTSEYMRNGDYAPTRLDAQTDAVHLLCSSKLQSNPENTVGVMCYGGTRVRLIAAPTNDNAVILAALHGLQPKGTADFAHVLKVAMLALNQRLNKHGHARIVTFVGSPVTATKEQLKKIGRTLKKNNVALDLILIGENQTNQEKLSFLINEVNNNDNSHLVDVTPGVLPSDALMSSPVILGEGAAAVSGGGQFGGVDPNIDPELAMAMQMSLEESRRAQEAQGGTEGAGVTGTEDDDELTRQAIALSLAEMSAAENQSSQAPPTAAQPAETTTTTGDIAAATTTAPTTATSGTAADPFSDPNFAASMLGGLEGVDMNDPAIQAMLAGLNSAGSAQQQQGDRKDEEDANEGKDNSNNDS